MNPRKWHLTCLRCNHFESDSLIETQEHLMEEHGVTQYQLQRETEREELAVNAHYRWTVGGTLAFEAVDQNALTIA